LTEIITPDALPAPVIERDPDDDHVLACAVCAKAQLIVSGDSHLLDLRVYQGIPSALPRLRSTRSSQHRDN
jgi:predicted nucleic acid-binding protein